MSLAEAAQDFEERVNTLSSKVDELASKVEEQSKFDVDVVMDSVWEENKDAIIEATVEGVKDKIDASDVAAEMGAGEIAAEISLDDLAGEFDLDNVVAKIDLGSLAEYIDFTDEQLAVIGKAIDLDNVKLTDDELAVAAKSIDLAALATYLLPPDHVAKRLSDLETKVDKIMESFEQMAQAAKFVNGFVNLLKEKI